MDCNLDVETGECVGNESDSEADAEPKQNTIRKTKFNVPKSYLSNSGQEKSNERCCLDAKETYSLSSKEKVMELKEVIDVYCLLRCFQLTIRPTSFQKIILGYNKTSHRLFLIPSLFMFPRVAAIFIVITEIAMHVWSHSKNIRNDNPKIYYRSPLHALTSQFCSLCLETKELHNDRYHKKRVVSSSLQ